MKKRIYLDNCSLNRPYDDYSQDIVKKEAHAKIRIQKMVRDGDLSLAYSFMSLSELEDSPRESKYQIINFLNDNADIYIEANTEIAEMANKIMISGIKHKDAIHLASAIFLNCDYFITTDKRLYRFIHESLNVINPIDFLNLKEN